MHLQECVDAVVFDFDGLMFNTEEVFDIAGRELLARRNLEMTAQLHASMLGRRPEEAYRLLIEHTGLTEPIPDLIAETQEIFESHLDEMLAPMPGLYELLAAVDRSGIPKAVATSSPRQYLDDLMSRFDLECRFPITLTAEDVTHGKPHPEIYLKAARMLDVAPQKMLVLEDSAHGSSAAAAAGARVVVVPHRHTQHHQFPEEATIAARLDVDEILTLLPEPT